MTSNQPELSNRLAIRELIELYGHLIDERQFSRLAEIFTFDASFDLAGFGGPRYEGLPAITEMMVTSTEHPLAHHATNIVIEALAADRATVVSKGIGVGHKGRVGSVLYRDLMVADNNGWRIAERFVALRTIENVPEIS